MRILFALSGLHRVHRGAEVAFISIATELAKRGDEVTLIGSGPELPGQAYRYIRAPAISRERFERLPSLPLFRSETVWEEASFIPGLLKVYDPSAYDVTVTCSYPFINWALRGVGGNRPRHVFVTQNGDWPAYANGAEYRFFGCDGLVCINPDYFDRNKDQSISVEQPRSPEARQKLAATAKESLKITVPVLLDTVGNDTAIAYGARSPPLYPGEGAGVRVHLTDGTTG